MTTQLQNNSHRNDGRDKISPQDYLHANSHCINDLHPLLRTNGKGLTSGKLCGS
jgi:hypothetical protein